jgi:hypothetical protein
MSLPLLAEVTPEREMAVRLAFGVTYAQLAAMEAHRLSHFYIVRNDGDLLGERAVCDKKKGGCGGRHAYFTWRCKILPYRGLHNALYALTEAINPNRESSFRFLPDAPNLASAHPAFARRFQPKGDHTSDLLGWAIGKPEPISAVREKLFRREIETVAGGAKCLWRGDRLVLSAGR